MNSSASLGIACSLVAWLFFSLGDVGIKYLSGDYPLHEIVLIRTVSAMTLTLAILVPLEGGYTNLKTCMIKLHVVRGLCVVVANMTFFLGLAALSLPEATSIFFIAPIFITVLSYFVLKENIGPYRWAAVVLGLIGVLIMLRPGSTSFRLAGLLPLLAAFAYANLNILTRKIGPVDKASTMSFYIQLMFLVVCTAFGLVLGDGRFGNTGNASLDFLFRAWTVPNTRDFLIMLGLGVCAALGGYMISQAYRISEAALIAPFEYVALLLAIFWGVTIWNEWPDTVAWIGITLIFSSGLIVFFRELVLGRKLVIHQPWRKPR